MTTALISRAQNATYFLPMGNVGIGTTQPAKKLDVNGTIQAYNMDVPGSITATTANLNYVHAAGLTTGVLPDSVIPRRLASGGVIGESNLVYQVAISKGYIVEYPYSYNYIERPMYNYYDAFTPATATTTAAVSMFPLRATYLPAFNYNGSVRKEKAIVFSCDFTLYTWNTTGDNRTMTIRIQSPLTAGFASPILNGVLVATISCVSSPTSVPVGAPIMVIKRLDSSNPLGEITLTGSTVSPYKVVRISGFYTVDFTNTTSFSNPQIQFSAASTLAWSWQPFWKARPIAKPAFDSYGWT